MSATAIEFKKNKLNFTKTFFDDGAVLVQAKIGGKNYAFKTTGRAGVPTENHRYNLRQWHLLEVEFVFTDSYKRFSKSTGDEGFETFLHSSVLLWENADTRSLPKAAE